jgi:formylglycine-generating enzyme required for sulfatase activity
MNTLKLAIIPALALLGFGFPNKPKIKERARVVVPQMVKVNDTFYIAKTELSNEEYAIFLAAHPAQSWLQPDATKWNNHPLGFRLVNDYSSFKNYPVVAITYEAAMEYCKWLTEIYMARPGRKFKKVKFTLPSRHDWLIAAHANKPDYMYPWGRWGTKSRTGEYLANYKVIGDEQISFDSSTQKFVVIVNKELEKYARLPAPVRSYWHKSLLGLYNVSGNVAEMVAEKGIAVGGSYNDAGYDVRIAAVKHYDQPSSEIGCRIAMYIQQ